ncbi:uncharacterized protein NDAI_0D00370 [Naumovozyma dairenensis CBS 421]|uniref:Yippee domain-containing protein n=1 Tax=Naumovozyma dairenensis (strain ATCC 10597 / BCRC 20456 / CBS 421 / NBRC 0211 / NRRL Y-12639) TaxID=1071378 RepID=G0W990_NAUDC|nr:hypothetical protein NDAI_0D00370 [Naumovozyma dairenensis CBS 421]CCD24351.1 hypothetical protein NDAI_0D00370 [Naumovozyma dairenensis CBS 421]
MGLRYTSYIERPSNLTFKEKKRSSYNSISNNRSRNENVGTNRSGIFSSAPSPIPPPRHLRYENGAFRIVRTPSSVVTTSLIYPHLNHESSTRSYRNGRRNHRNHQNRHTVFSPTDNDFNSIYNNQYDENGNGNENENDEYYDEDEDGEGVEHDNMLFDNRMSGITRSIAPSNGSISLKKFMTFGCRHCRTHLSSSNEIMSKDYRGKTGDAYLMDHVVNVIEGTMETRPMITGEYLVCDILCHWCKNLVGWKYIQSEMNDQKFKEGKYILELETICLCD